MRQTKLTCIGITLAALAMGGSNIRAAAVTPEAPLNEVGQKLEASYTGQLKSLQAEIARSLPKLDEQQAAALQRAREAVKAAQAAVTAAQQPLDKIAGAAGLVGHAKGKWLGGAEKGIAAAEAALKKATTDAERAAAQKDLTHWF